MSAQITLNEAKSMTHAFQNSTIGSNQTFAGLVDKTNLLTLLNQEGCTGLRIYNALNDDGKITFVLVGVNSNNEDMTNYILDRLQACPPVCPPDSPLM
jgi:hypothetical protein